MGMISREVGWGALLVLAGGLAGALIVVGVGPGGVKVPTGDPPIIVHGGSFHLWLKGADYTYTNKRFTLSAVQLTKLWASDGFGKAALPAAGWKEVRVCTDSGCGHGVVMSPGANNKVTIDVESLPDFVIAGQSTTTGGVTQTDYEIQGNNLGEFYPTYLSILDTNEKTTTFSCTPKLSAVWTNCWVEIGVVPPK
jgi:hypothetical protein